MTVALTCGEAVTEVCTFFTRGDAKDPCGKRKHCGTCKKHLCPVCGGHYRMMIFAESETGCCNACVKITNNDTEPFYPGRKRASESATAQ